MVTPRTGWKDMSELLGRHLCWKYSSGTHRLRRKIGIMGVDLKTMCGVDKKPSPGPWEASDFTSAVWEKLVDGILERWRVWEVGVGRMPELPLC